MLGKQGVAICLACLVGLSENCDTVLQDCNHLALLKDQLVLKLHLLASKVKLHAVGISLDKVLKHIDDQLLRDQDKTIGWSLCNGL